MVAHKSFGQTMQLVMDEKKLKPVDIWKDSELLTQQYVSKLLTGRLADPTFDRACEIIDRLGMTLDEFVELQKKE